MAASNCLLRSRVVDRQSGGNEHDRHALAKVKQSALKEPAASFCAAAIAKLRLSDGAMDKEGLKERIASRVYLRISTNLRQLIRKQAEEREALRAQLSATR